MINNIGAGMGRDLTMFSPPTLQTLALVDTIDFGPTSAAINLSWSGGGTSYTLQRSSDGTSWSDVVTKTSTSATDTRPLDAVMLYRVVGSSGATQVTSNTILVTTFRFTDDPLTPRQTVIRCAHFRELVTAINTVRAAAQLPALSVSFALNNCTVSKTDIEALRNGLDAALTHWNLAPVTHCQAALTQQQSLIRACDVAELRAAMR